MRSETSSEGHACVRHGCVALSTKHAIEFPSPSSWCMSNGISTFNPLALSRSSSASDDKTLRVHKFGKSAHVDTDASSLQVDNTDADVEYCNSAVECCDSAAKRRLLLSIDTVDTIEYTGMSESESADHDKTNVSIDEASDESDDIVPPSL